MGFLSLNEHVNEKSALPLDIWQFQDALTRRLTWWSIGSILSGAWMLWGVPLMQAEPSLRSLFNPVVEPWRGMGVQFLAWGGIDLAIAVFGAAGTRRRKSKLTPAELIAAQAQERTNLARILWINTSLDVLYVIGGLTLAYTLGAANLFWWGGGWGIVIQGGFLFFFDLFHALKLR